mgnify:CR=1 FL=1
MFDDDQTELEIWWEDLSTDLKTYLLEFYEVDSPEEMNWDVFPVTVVTREPKGE